MFFIVCCVQLNFNEMEHIAFVLWMVLYPVGASICSYIATKERKINNEEPYTSAVKAFSGLINLVIWICVAKALF
jgi:hypothetical protein